MNDVKFLALTTEEAAAVLKAVEFVIGEFDSQDEVLDRVVRRIKTKLLP